MCRFYYVIVENCLVLLIENQMEENEIINKIRKITTCNSDLSHNFGIGLIILLPCDKLQN